MRGSKGSVVALAFAGLWVCAAIGSWGAAFAQYAKKPMNAYMHFAAEKRPFYADQGKSVGEASKALGADWAAMSAVEKAKYDDMAKADKVRYENDLNSGLEAKPKKSKKKEANKPKRARNAYVLFMSAQHAKLNEAGNTATAAERVKEAAAIWRGMSDAEKQPFVDEAAREKQRSAEEREARKGPKGPKRPRSAYILFVKEQLPKLKETGAYARGVVDMTKEIGAMWRGMSDAEKQPFLDKAAQDKERFKLETA